MYPYIRCFCGYPLGDIYELFCAMRNQLKIAAVHTQQKNINIDVNSNIAINPSIIPISDDVQIELKPVFEALQIKHQCCRARLMTVVEYTEVY